MVEVPVHIDVDAEQFSAFNAVYKDFHAALKEAPGEWGKVAAATGEAAESAGALREALEAGGDALAHAASLGSKFQQSAERAATAFGKVQSATKGAAANIKEATVALLKWSALTLVGGGIGAWSMDAIGTHVSGVRTGAMRAGTTAGGREAFAINFARFGDAEGVLGRVANIKNSADHTALRNLGITDAEINSMDPADLAALAYKKLQERAKGQNPNFLGDWLSSNRVNEVFDLGAALQARSTSSEEMADVQGHYQRDRPRLEMTPQAQLGWTKFTMQLDLAAGVISKVFSENLAHLTGGLGHLSDAFSKVLEILLKQGGPVEHLLQDLNDGLEGMVDVLGSEINWRKLFGELADGMVAVAKWTWKLIEGLATVAKWFGISPAGAATSGYGNGAGADDVSGVKADRGRLAGDASNSELKGVIDRAAREAGIDPHTMYGIVAGESLHRDRYDVKDDALESSWGPFQLNRRRGLGVQFERETGLDVRDPKTIPQQAQWVAQFLKRGGALRNWAGYHGNREWNPNWGNAGLQTQNAPQVARTRVTITKAPGGDVAAGANAAAHQSP